MQTLLSEIRARLRRMYASLQQGDDVPPAVLLRIEGLLEAAVVMDIADQQTLDAMVNECHSNIWQCTLEQAYGADWREFYAFPQIPFMAQRAPVYPSTKT